MVRDAFSLLSLTRPPGQALLFIDGAPVSGGEVGSFIDVQRVEVLRGPQSAYFGRSTFSGAVNLVSADPSDNFGGKVSGEYGRFGTNDIQGMLEGPIIPDVLNFRVAGRRTEKAGNYINNASGKREVGDELTKAMVGTLLFKPADFIRLKVRGITSLSTMDQTPHFDFHNRSLIATRMVMEP